MSISSIQIEDTTYEIAASVIEEGEHGIASEIPAKKVLLIYVLKRNVSADKHTSTDDILVFIKVVDQFGVSA
jgi:hypothetical protein